MTRLVGFSVRLVSDKSAALCPQRMCFISDSVVTHVENQAVKRSGQMLEVADSRGVDLAHCPLSLPYTAYINVTPSCLIVQTEHTAGGNVKTRLLHVQYPCCNECKDVSLLNRMLK